MTILPKYNPCLDYINYLKKYFLDTVISGKNINIKYDNKCFITNLTKKDIDIAMVAKDYDCYFSDKGILILNANNSFFKDYIIKCPEIDLTEIDDVYYSGILKRMYSQIYFGFYEEGEIDEDNCDICHNIFKSIYTKSVDIKKKNIMQCMEKFNALQKSKHIQKSVIYGIIYAVYDINNSLSE